MEYVFSEPYIGEEEYIFSDVSGGRQSRPYTGEEEEEEYVFSKPYTGEEEEEYIFSEPYSGVENPECNSSYDLITLTEWSVTPPDIKINFYSEDDERLFTNCYRSEALKKWVDDSNNIFAFWINRGPGIQMDSVGHGGRPDLSHLVVKLYTGEFVLRNDVVGDIVLGLSNVVLNAYPIGIKRIGNTKGTFGISELHGQAPGYRIYRLEVGGSLAKPTNITVADPLTAVYKEFEKRAKSNTGEIWIVTDGPLIGFTVFGNIYNAILQYQEGINESKKWPIYIKRDQIAVALLDINLENPPSLDEMVDDVIDYFQSNEILMKF